VGRAILQISELKASVEARLAVSEKKLAGTEQLVSVQVDKMFAALAIQAEVLVARAVATLVRESAEQIAAREAKVAAAEASIQKKHAAADKKIKERHAAADKAAGFAESGAHAAGG